MEKPRLSFRADGSFKILQLTDTHVSGYDGKDTASFALIRCLIERENPDLVAFTGDIVGSSVNCVRYMDRVNGILEELNKPHTFVFGNHESDGRAGKALSEALEKYPLSLFETGPEELSGYGNYAVPVFGPDGSPVWMLYHFDCNNNINYKISPGKTVKADGYVTRDQINWFLSEHSKRRADGSKKLPSLVFCHVPLPEFNDVWMFDGVFGTRHEKVYTPPVNSGLFTAMWETGDVKGVFAGHDHVNSFYGRMFGIILAYGRNSGYHCNCEENFKRGGRVITLSLSKGDIEDTYITYHNGETEHEDFSPPLYDRFDYYFK